MRLGKIVLCLMVLFVSAEARTLAELRQRVSWYLNDYSDLMVGAAVKDSILNVSQEQYSAEFPVHLDTGRQALTVGTRFYAMPSNFGGQVSSVHKVGPTFVDLKYIPTDSLPQMDKGTVQFYSVKQTKGQATLIIYPRPVIADDTIFYFYHASPTALSHADTECSVVDYAEEPIVLLAVSKLWAMQDMNLQLSSWFYERYLITAGRITRTQVEVPRSD